MTSNLRILAVALVLAAGCSALVDPEKNDPLKTAEGFCNSVQDVLVDVIQRCNPGNAAFVEMIQAYRVGCDNLDAAVAEGRMGYDRALGEACLAALDGASCALLGDSIFETCALATPGKVPAGNPCLRTGGGRPSDCTSDSTCVAALACPGTCVTKPTLAGAACGASTNYECGGGLVCVYQPTTGTSLCANPVGIGGVCSGSSDCVDGAYCDYSGTPSTCQTIPTTPQPAGGDCYYNGDSGCQPGLYCAWNLGDTCQPIQPLGSTCVYGSECGQPPNTCSRVPGVPTGTCIRARLLGEACIAGNEECASELWCDASAPGASGVCRGPSADGGTCQYPYAAAVTAEARYTEYARCAFGLRCVDPSGGVAYPYKGFCARYLDAGDFCGTSDDACGAPWTGMICDQALPTPACNPSACAAPFGWLPWG